MIKLNSIKPSTKIDAVFRSRIVTSIDRANKTLAYNGKKIKTIRDLSHFSELEISMIKGVGSVLAKEIINAIILSSLKPAPESIRLNDRVWQHIFIRKPEVVRQQLKAIVVA